MVLAKTAIMMNLGNPDLAFRSAMMPNAGVGLARMEFMISEHIGIHPMALIHPEKVSGQGSNKSNTYMGLTVSREESRELRHHKPPFLS